MSVPGSLFKRFLRIPLIFSPSTDVGKTVVTTLLCKTASKLWKDENVHYLKPVSTGSIEEADSRHIHKYLSIASVKTLYQYDQPKSPHSAALESGKTIPTDIELLSKIHESVHEAPKTPGWLFIETAGGVHSPGPSGNTQANIYAPLRIPVILVGDPKLGGISQTISAFESLHIRGYEVQSIVLFRDDVYENYRYLADYFHERHQVPVWSVSNVPARKSNQQHEQQSMSAYYENESESNGAKDLLEHFDNHHQSRILALESMPEKAYQHIWFPFTQQKLLSPEGITVIDSANGDWFQTLSRGVNSENLLQSSFDGSASWWTQGLGHGNAQLTLAAAYAAGRYGHVMFAESVHKPALSLAEALLTRLRNPRLSRVFFSDNGSTGCEVAVKMALRAARTRYGWDTQSGLSVLGLKGSYHGDTIGAMDCSEPCTFNEKVEWYEGKGYWFDYPSVKCTRGHWVVEVPRTLRNELGEGQRYKDLADVFDIEKRESAGESTRYEAFIEKTLRRLKSQGFKFGALMLEPVILGAGGMIFVDPLFQRSLVKVVRQSPHLFGTCPNQISDNSTTWTGLPVIFDEVFTGMYRLGRYTSSSFLGVHPDISVHAKLLTGGLVPLCTTLASESVFEAFLNDDKSEALLHGHSYTAHAVGCQVALESLREMTRLEEIGAWDKFKQGWIMSTKAGSNIWSIWSAEFVNAISTLDSKVDGVWALGSVLAITLRSGGQTGYKSVAAQSLKSRLGEENSEGHWNIHSRVLGNVFYLMAGQKITLEVTAGVERLILDELSETAGERMTGAITKDI